MGSMGEWNTYISPHPVFNGDNKSYTGYATGSGYRWVIELSEDYDNCYTLYVGFACTVCGEEIDHNDHNGHKGKSPVQHEFSPPFPHTADTVSYGAVLGSDGNLINEQTERFDVFEGNTYPNSVEFQRYSVEFQRYLDQNLGAYEALVLRGELLSALETAVLRPDADWWLV